MMRSLKHEHTDKNFTHKINKHLFELNGPNSTALEDLTLKGSTYIAYDRGNLPAPYFWLLGVM
jgi:hypothetical protein